MAVIIIPLLAKQLLICLIRTFCSRLMYYIKFINNIWNKNKWTKYK